MHSDVEAVRKSVRTYLTIGGALLVFTVGWRQAAFISGIVFLLVVPILAYFVRNTPESMGLPPVELYKGEESATQLAEETGEQESYWSIVVRS